MAANLPVGATVNEAYRFGLNRMGTILRLFWLPTLLGMAILFGVLFSLIDFQKAQSAAPTTLGEAVSLLRLPLPAFVAAVIVASLPMALLVSGAVASVYRLVALGEDRRGLFQLRLDGPAFRVFFASIIQGLINYGIFGVAALVVWATTRESPIDGLKAYFEFFMKMANAGAGAQPSPEDMRGLAVNARPFFLACMFAFLPALYLGVKLAPFPAASAAENRLVLFGTFRMTFGYWWSMFGSWVLFGVAFVLLSIVFGLGEGILQLVAKFLGQQGGAMAALGGGVALLLAVVRIVFQLFTLGVQLALPAVMYRRIAKGE